MFTEEHLYSIALRRCQSIGDGNFHKLVNTIGSAKEVWDFCKKSMQKIDGVGKKISADIGNPEHLKFAENEIQFCEKNNIFIKLRHLKELPNLLQECGDAPAILYQKGTYNTSFEKISIVGTRNFTAYGKTFLENFLSEINSKKIVTVSGLALGADTEVHEKSIENNLPTIAVLAHGFHTLYPSQNRKLSNRILENGGALFTEFNSSQKPDRENFIQRNRIVAALSASTIVLETAFGGGSISTATFANNYNREVYALPGRITDKYSQGCNLLISQNKAATISTIKDLLTQLNFDDNSNKMEELFPRSEIKLELKENQLSVYNLIKENPSLNLDDISMLSEFPSHKILGILLELELLGVLKSLSGKKFVAI
ncbi:DNA-processing protein DprA [Frigoriflavimonas asaccharolytica]|uniref:DNA processing protein n=1 Tax=Frigoriflavimonas asaccharolytica TaxID=2735899 RepID=A0A8J8G8C4_9FLAO|nr:DNA-processing protein DprA [Frigoriflavimonas asaccharolytica]NRS91150.1 DNA processing protein [Frigoriflavimonas asaccharolytica]